MKIYTKEDLNNKEISEAFYSVIELEALDSVSKIIEDVKNNKNKALIEYSKSFNDGNFENEKDFFFFLKMKLKKHTIIPIKMLWNP